MMTDSSTLGVVISLANCYPESEIFVLRRKYSGEKCLKYKPLVLIIILMQRNQFCSLGRFKKMHWAAHKHTAAEIIFSRADFEKDNMRLTSWEGK